MSISSSFRMLAKPSKLSFSRLTSPSDSASSLSALKPMGADKFNATTANLKFAGLFKGKKMDTSRNEAKPKFSELDRTLLYVVNRAKLITENTPLKDSDRTLLESLQGKQVSQVAKNQALKDITTSSRQRNQDIAWILVSKLGAEVNAIVDDLPILHWGVDAGNYWMVDFLLGRGANIGILDNNKNNVLHASTSNRGVNIIELILDKERNRNALQPHLQTDLRSQVNEDGKIPMETVSQHRHTKDERINLRIKLAPDEKVSTYPQPKYDPPPIPLASSSSTQVFPTVLPPRPEHVNGVPRSRSPVDVDAISPIVNPQDENYGAPHDVKNRIQEATGPMPEAPIDGAQPTENPPAYSAQPSGSNEQAGQSFTPTLQRNSTVSPSNNSASKGRFSLPWWTSKPGN